MNVWEGAPEDGRGRLTTASGVLSDTSHSITALHLDVTAAIHGADEAAFATAAANARAGCPVSRVLNAKITMDARLVASA